jgi:hypothetical protein
MIELDYKPEYLLCQEFIMCHTMIFLILCKIILYDNNINEIH